MARTGLRRLPGVGRGITAISRLWLGDGFLLAVEGSGYREAYKHIELADIQGFVIQRTNTLQIRATITAVVTLAVGVLAYTLRDDSLLLGLALVAPPASLLIADLSLGRTCKVQLRTPVQQMPLPSLGRWRRANRVIARLRPLIEERQGTMLDEELQARYGEIQPLPPEAKAPDEVAS